MNRMPIKDDRYRVVGYIDTGQDGKQRGLNARFQTVGYYDPQRDETKDARYRLVARGNALSALIFGCAR